MGKRKENEEKEKIKKSFLWKMGYNKIFMMSYKAPVTISSNERTLPLLKRHEIAR